MGVWKWAPRPWATAITIASVIGCGGCNGIYNDVASATSFTEHHDLEANGLDHQLYAVHGDAMVTSAAIPSPGVPYHLVVSRHDAYDATCNDVLPPRSAGIHLQGGGGFSRTCTSPPTAAIELVSATCDGNACMVQPTASASPEQIELDVVVPTESDVTLHVRVRRVDGTGEYEDRYPLTVHAPNRIFAADRSTAAISHVILPGAVVSLQFALYWNDRPVELGREVVFETTSSTTDVIARDAGSTSTTFRGVAERAGTTTLTVTSSGLSRTLPVRVGAEADVVKIAFNHALYSTDKEDAPAHDAGEDPVGAPYTEHTSTEDGLALVMVLTLADGSLALGGVSHLNVTPTAKPPVRIGTAGVQDPVAATAFFTLSPDYYGSGTVTTDIGHAHFSWDVTSPQP